MENHTNQQDDREGSGIYFEAGHNEGIDATGADTATFNQEPFQITQQTSGPNEGELDIGEEGEESGSGSDNEGEDWGGEWEGWSDEGEGWSDEEEQR
ncbi:hypothetical protein MMC12_005970 [Toensbergia leucococca]|nr:hypothetical protein [Toensbergia leucococca]